MALRSIKFRLIVPVVQEPPLPDMQDVVLELPAALASAASLPPAMA